MPTEFWITIALMGVVAVASIYTGYQWGFNACHNQWIARLNDEFRQEFMKTMYNQFVQKFEERIRQREEAMDKEYEKLKAKLEKKEKKQK